MVLVSDFCCESASFDVALFLWSAGTCPRFPLFSLDTRGLNGRLAANIGALVNAPFSSINMENESSDKSKHSKKRNIKTSV